MGKENGKDTITVSRMPSMFKRFSRLLPRLFRRLSSSLHVWSEYPSLHTAPIALPAVGAPTGSSRGSPEAAHCARITCFPYQYESYQLPSRHLQIQEMRMLLMTTMNSI